MGGEKMVSWIHHNIDIWCLNNEPRFHQPRPITTNIRKLIWLAAEKSHCYHIKNSHQEQDTSQLAPCVIMLDLVTGDNWFLKCVELKAFTDSFLMQNLEVLVPVRIFFSLDKILLIVIIYSLFSSNDPDLKNCSEL